MTYLPEPLLLSQLRAKLAEKPPFCSGILSLPTDQLDLYFGQENAHFVNFSRSAEKPEAIASLADACQPAVFGKGNETVLDETYRKAGKMDTSAFLARFDAERAGLMRTVHTGLFSGEDESRSIRSELYKLNVYGEGAFFKAHQDTPRAADMFGSLVVVLPAPHEGGALALRHDGKEWIFDATELLAGRTDAVAYVAFFSDVEHEVLPVRSGHRVTLTYNLFYGTRVEDTVAPPSGLLARAPPHADRTAIGDALAALLGDASFLPEGGTLGFGLRHKYPFPTVWTDKDPDPLKCLQGWLKGGDDALFRACGTLGLSPYLRLVCRHDGPTVVLDRMVDLEGMGYDSDIGWMLLSEGRGPRLISKFFGEDPEAQWRRWKSSRDDDDLNDGTPKLEVHWVTETQTWNGTTTQYISLGNQPTLGHFYASVCLLVGVGPPGKRVIEEKTVEEQEEGELAGKEGN